MGKGENAGNQHFLLFPSCFLPIPKQISVFSISFKLWSANAFNLEQSKILLFGKELKHHAKHVITPILIIECILFNPFPNKPWLLCVYRTSLLKTLWDKEKLLVMSNSSFSQIVSAILFKFEIVVCKFFNLVESKICCLGKG